MRRVALSLLVLAKLGKEMVGIYACKLLGNQLSLPLEARELRCSFHYSLTLDAIARWVLERAFGPHCSPLLQETVQSTGASREVRAYALSLLARLKDASLMPVFERAFLDEALEVSEAAAHALAEIGVPALDTLIPYLHSSRWSHKKAAILALKQIGGSKVERALQKLRETEQDVTIQQLL